MSIELKLPQTINIKTKGKIIEIEGTDCSFKETNSIALYNYIKENITDKVLIYHFPNYNSSSSDEVKQLLNGEIKTDTPTSIFFFALDRYRTLIKEDSNGKNIYDYLEEGYYIIFDRYIGSNYIYQAYNNEFDDYDQEMERIIDSIEYDCFQLPKADIVISLASEYDIIKEKMANRRKNNGISKDIYEEDEEKMRKAYDSVLFFTNRYNWNLIYVTEDGKPKSGDDIFNQILLILNQNNFL